MGTGEEHYLVLEGFRLNDSIFKVFIVLLSELNNIFFDVKDLNRINYYVKLIEDNFSALQ